MVVPAVVTRKSDVPIVFLDSNIFIEMKRAIDGNCHTIYAGQLIELYNLLTELMRRKLIICPVGSQQDEIGVSKKRQGAEEFLLRFTNAEVLTPYEIKQLQLDTFYSAYKNSNPNVELSSEKVLREEHSISGFKIRVVSYSSADVLNEKKESKDRTVELVNELRSSGRASKVFEKQFSIELTAEQQIINEALRMTKGTPEDIITSINILAPIYSRIDSLPSSPDFVETFSEYLYGFLPSLYLSNIPYIIIESLINAYKMCTDIKLLGSDAQDIQNASAYLPYVDFFVTDKSLCNTIKALEIDSLYGAKVYAMKDLTSLLFDLRNLLVENNIDGQ
ncbi:MAG: hypothetical protein ABFC56_07680 [Clostridiaceae bacterium]